MAAKDPTGAAGISMDRFVFYGEGDTVPDLETLDLGHKTYMEEAEAAGQASFCTG
ncbi:hypothetical protein D3C73_1597160 [compost metagenome]